jgi:hypothetical protein
VSFKRCLPLGHMVKCARIWRPVSWAARPHSISSAASRVVGFAPLRERGIVHAPMRGGFGPAGIVAGRHAFEKACLAINRVMRIFIAHLNSHRTNRYIEKVEWR